MCTFCKPHPNPNECPCALLCLVYCAGRAQSCFLTILRISSVLLTRLAPASCTLHPEFYTPWLHLTHAYVHTPLGRVITSTCSYRACAHALHATTSSCAITPTATAYAPHNLCILAAAPDTSAMRRHVRVRTYNTHAHIHDYTIVHARSICIRI